MSLLNDFKADYPLTIKNLEKWLIDIIEILEKPHTIVIDFAFLTNIANNVNRGTDITSTFSNANFEAIFENINDGLPVKAKSEGKTINMLSVEISEVASDDFKAIELTYIYGGNLITLTFSKFGTNVFLDNKVIKAL